MTSLIVGANGLIGRRLCERLSRTSVGVVATTRRMTGLPAHPQVRWKAVDLSTFDGWDKLLEGVETLYHLAWSTIPASADPDPARDILENVVGTVRMLEAARRAPGLRIVFASSGGSVYGAPEGLPVSEAHPTRPVSAYGISKLMVEHYLDKYRAIYGLDGVALRISNCYGARQQPQKGLGAVTLFARAGLRREPLKLFGAGDVVRDYIHVDDVVDAMIAAGARRNVTGPINIGSGVGHSLREVIAKLEAALGHRFDVHQAPPRRFDVAASVLDVARAQDRLGWTPTINLDVGIELLLAELRSELESECGSRSSSIATIPSIFTARKAILGH
ncbi:NAD-dependent epimerase/dehydratase family protein [Xanthobacter autotrophicus]|uniref:NAD-dependent epimerase/dehydratase family protein n=1 Tax=Xanthobacter TaxID=279 RepID=UPI0024AAFCAD|nr:NAD-dependent epimerase/dehydratase family protein [Xanthobacter autotrophicus]MDI4663235.1 NAD-dependent epimerase/dehydratase family protein [Xanthobacter autotrophicus]